MKYILDNDMHIHSHLSICSGDEGQTYQAILAHARKYGLKTVVITDHFWDEAVQHPELKHHGFYLEQDFAHITSDGVPPQTDGIRFLFGCETEMTYDMTVGLARENYDKFDFVIVPTTHFHFKGFTITEDISTPEQKAELWVKKLDALLGMKLPYHKMGIAHLCCCLIEPSSREAFVNILSLISDGDLKRVFSRAAAVGIGIELNAADFDFKLEGEQEAVLRIFRAAKNEGCKFYLGSDAHSRVGHERSIPLLQRAIDLLELTEDDKFRLEK